MRGSDILLLNAFGRERSLALMHSSHFAFLLVKFLLLKKISFMEGKIIWSSALRSPSKFRYWTLRAQTKIDLWFLLNWKENCHYDHDPFNFKRIIDIFLSMWRERSLTLMSWNHLQNLGAPIRFYKLWIYAVYMLL